ncbi:transcription-repair coupling factor (superfamily II helicase) [Alteromonadaceae bacterium 2753L.S.0a.02]|nr:transcription-repair coupling factor (superfamily II helicase) [Alteromonadaceae bacterium 2753L.S.0a.02]
MSWFLENVCAATMRRCAKNCYYLFYLSHTPERASANGTVHCPTSTLSAHRRVQAQNSSFWRKNIHWRNLACISARAALKGLEKIAPIIRMRLGQRQSPSEKKVNKPLFFRTLFNRKYKNQPDNWFRSNNSLYLFPYACRPLGKTAKIAAPKPQRYKMKHTELTPQLPQRSRDKRSWGQLMGTSGSALAIASAARKFSGNCLVITPDMASAETFKRDINAFLKGDSGGEKVYLFNDWETLPYDSFSPHQDIISERMRCLYRMHATDNCIIVVASSTLMQCLPPAEFILSRSLVLRLHDTLERESFRQKLIDSGYTHVDNVFQHGEFAVRGALIDVYPMGSRAAYRIELFDDCVDSLREFDPETQRTITQVESIELLPGKEFPLDKAGISAFKGRWHEAFDVDHTACPVYQDISSGLSPAGIEYYLPLFFEQTATLVDYLPSNPENTLLFVHEQVPKAIETMWRDIEARYESRCGDRERPILPPHRAFHPVDKIYSALKPYPRVTLHLQAAAEGGGVHNLPLAPSPALAIDNKAHNPLHLVENFLLSSDKRVLFCAESSGRKETLKEQLQKIAVTPDEVDSISAFLNTDCALAITVADITTTVNSNNPSFILIAEEQLFGNRIQQKRRRTKTSDEADGIIKNLTELKPGAPVVHMEHGVGRYKGLQTIEHDGQADEFLVLAYADDTKLYVPVANLHLISRYSGADESLAPLHRLGSETWQKAKRKAAEQIRDVAAELLEIYAKRKARKGFSYSNPKEAYQQFSAGFPFEETPDQEAAIAAVREDMLSAQPMDRLVCGDVGFGKTEVAMRAAFIAVQNSKQVAVLVPTTLLAQQHFDNFKDRFADWPINVEVVSRFRSQKETTDIQKRLENGKVDIIIGTHKLIQADMKYANLGLVIIDEEHRFGVRQKETLKAMRTEVDILTLTATPIPRTLNMSMNGIRDLSIIATPPAKRLSVKTFVRESDENLIKEAILREILRGGQVYLLHNEVSTINRRAEELQALVPEARIGIGHGQMRERELESVMSDFYHKRFNILVCTTIIETGIDVPTANTIVIERADKFGLAQLHQLRGRVGRSHHQAYAYLMTPHKKAMTADALKRLEAIAEAQDLGAGFTLASHDLEIRGAGELLGDEQSGQMHAIGFSLYMDMLDRAVKAIREGKTIDLDKPEQSGVEINLRIPALIPDDYLPDVHTRLILYKRLASVQTEDALNELQVEMIDRFGLFPEPIKNLFRQTRIRFQAEQMGITKVEASRQGGKLEFASETQVDPLTIVKLVQKLPQHYRLEGANQLKFLFDMDDNESRITTVNNVLQQLQQAS